MGKGNGGGVEIWDIPNGNARKENNCPKGTVPNEWRRETDGFLGIRGIRGAENVWDVDCLNPKGQITGEGGGCGVFRRYESSPLPFTLYPEGSERTDGGTGVQPRRGWVYPSEHGGCPAQQ